MWVCVCVGGGSGEVDSGARTLSPDSGEGAQERTLFKTLPLLLCQHRKMPPAHKYIQVVQRQIISDLSDARRISCECCPLVLHLEDESRQGASGLAHEIRGRVPRYGPRGPGQHRK